MTMTHKEALAKAIEAFYTEVDNLDGSDIEAAIRAYIEARGLALVPKSPTFSMVSAYCEKQEKFGVPFFANATAIWEAILEASPNQFDGSAS